VLRVVGRARGYVDGLGCVRSGAVPGVVDGLNMHGVRCGDLHFGGGVRGVHKLRRGQVLGLDGLDCMLELCRGILLG
jgi:hypothetical protein